ncbi:autotransporter-associated beta strand repeat-containing protein [Planctomycetota bacterium]|nr:autotransporter-associated beta strand repeat-containing protein [Planctomycetota bacterium]
MKTPVRTASLLPAAMALIAINTANFTASPASAATFTWDGSENSLWSTSGNWSTSSGVPDSDDIVVFSGPASHTFVELNGSRTIQELNFGGTTNYSLSDTISSDTLTLITGDIIVTGTATHRIFNNINLGSTLSNWSISENAELKVSGTINGNSTFEKTGTGTLTLSGGDEFTSSTFDTLTSASGTVILDGAHVNLTNTNDIALHAFGGDITLQAGAVVTLDNTSGRAWARGNTLTITGNGTSLTGNDVLVWDNGSSDGSLIVKENATLTLSGDLSVGAGDGNDGGIAIQSGAQVSADRFLIRGSSSTQSSSSSTVTGDGSLLSVNNLSLTAPFIFTVEDGGTVDVANLLLITGSDNNITVNGGTLEIGQISGATDFSISGDDALIIGTNDSDSSIDGAIEDAAGGAGALVKNGTGTLTLSGDNTYSGGTTISAGTVIASGGNAIGDSGTVTIADVDGAILQLNNDETIGALAGGGTTGGLVNLGDNTLTVTDDSDTTFAGVITGTGDAFSASSRLVKQGSGTFTLTGGTDGDPSTIYSLFSEEGTITLDGARLDLTSNEYNSVNPALSASGGDVILQNGADVQFTGGTANIGLVTGSTLTVTSGASLTGNAIEVRQSALRDGRIIVEDSATLDLNTLFIGSSTNSGELTVQSGGKVSGNFVYLKEYGTGWVTGSGSELDANILDLNGTGTLTVKDSGAVEVSNYIKMTSGSSLTITDDGTFQTKYLYGSGTISISGSDALTVGIDNATDEYTFSGVIQDASDGAGAFTKEGTSILTLTGNNTYTGGTTISGGTLQIGSGGMTGSIQGDILNNATLEFNRSDALTYTGMISGTGELTQNGTGILMLTGTNTYSGGTTISSGTLIAYGGNAIGDSGTVTIADVLDATLQLNTDETIGALAGGGSTGGEVRLQSNTLTVGDANSTTFDGVITGTGNLIKQGSGILTLTGTNTYSGDTTISAGTLQIGDGGTTGSIQGDILNNATLAFNRSDDLTYAGVISESSGSSGALIKAGAGTLTLTGTNTFTGGTTISGGTLQIGDYDPTDGSGGTTGSIQGDIVNSGTLAFNRSDDITYADVISGTGSLVKNGSGTLTLSGTNTYTGDTTISDGTIYIDGTDQAFGGADANGDYGTVTFTGDATIDTSSDGIDVYNNIEIGSHDVIFKRLSNPPAGATLNFHGDISGDEDSLLVLDADLDGYLRIIDLKGDNSSFAGDITASGTVGIYNDNVLGTGTLTNMSGKYLRLYARNSVVLENNMVVTDYGGPYNQLQLVLENDMTLNGVISGTGRLSTWPGYSGTLTLNGANTYEGGTQLNAGRIVVVGNDSAFGTGSVTVNGAVDLSAGLNATTGLSSFTLANAFILNGDLTISGDNDLTLDDVIDGTGALIKEGSGTLTLNGVNTYSGGTTLSAGGITVGDDDALGTSSLTVSGASELSAGISSVVLDNTVTLNDTLTVIGDNDLTFTNVISGTGALANTGDGILTLTGGTDANPTSFDSLISNGGSVILDGANINLTGTDVDAQSALSAYFGDITLQNGSVVELDDASGNVWVNDTLTVTDSGSELSTNALTVYVMGSLNIDDGSVVEVAGETVLSNTLNITGNDNSISIDGGTLRTDKLSTESSRSLPIISISGDDALVVGINNGSSAFDGKIQDVAGEPGTLTKEGSGTFYLAGANTYTGGTIINGGTLQLGSAGDNLGLKGSIQGNVVNNATFAFYRNNDLTFAGVISGTGQVIKKGSGTLTLSGVNTYSGGTTLTEGGITVGSVTALGDGTLTVSGASVLSAGASSITLDNAITLNAGLTISGDNDLTLTKVISDGTSSGALAKTGAGTLILSGTNTYTGGTTLSAGGLTVGDDDALGDGSLTVGGASELSAGASSVTLGNAVTLNDDLTISGTNDLTLDGVISDGASIGSLTKTGSGTLTLTGTNTYTGGTTLSGGTVDISGNSNAFGSVDGNGDYGTVTVTGDATIQSYRTNFQGETYLSNDIVIDPTATLTVYNYNYELFSKGEISGEGNLVLDAYDGDAGILYYIRMYEDNSGFTGDVTASGQIEIHADNVFGTGTITAKEPLNLESIADITLGNDISINIESDYGLKLDIYGDMTLDGVISGSSLLRVADFSDGTLTLNGMNTYGGGTTILSGDTVVVVGNDSAFGTGSVTVDSTLDLSAGVSSVTLGNAVILNDDLTISGDNNLTFTDVISGTGALIKEGNGALTLTGTNTYSGGTTISAGTLQIGDGGTTGSILGDVLNNGTLAFNRSDDLIYTGVISESSGSSGSFVKAGDGTLTLTGTNTYSGLTTIMGGTLQIGNGGTTGSIQGSILNNATLAFNRSDDLTYSNLILGIGNLVKEGAGTLTLSGTNTYSGGTTLSGGTVIAGSDSAFGDSGGLVSVTANTSLESDDDTRTLGNDFEIDLGSTLTVDGLFDLWLTGDIDGEGGLTKEGDSTLVLSGNNTYTSATLVSGGILQVMGDDALGNGELTILGSAELIVADIVTVLGNDIVIDLGQTFTVGELGDMTLSGDISGDGSLLKVGDGTLTLSGDSTYHGGTNLSAGGIAVGSDTALGDGTLTVSGASALGTGASSVTLGNAITLDDDLTITGDNDLTLTDVISGTGALAKTGDGTLTLSGDNTYSGGTTISAGTVIASGGNAIGDSGTVTIADVDGAILQLNNDETIGALAGGGTTGGRVDLGGNILTVIDDSDTTFAGVITGTDDPFIGYPRLVKQGSGTFTLTGGTDDDPSTFSSLFSEEGTVILDGARLDLTSYAYGLDKPALFAHGGDIIIQNDADVQFTSGTLNVGFVTGSTLTVTSGASLTVHTIDVRQRLDISDPSLLDTTGRLIVEDSATLDFNILFIGTNNEGELTVQSGGKVSGNSVYLKEYGTGWVTGSGSELDANVLEFDRTGSLTVKDSGAVEVSNVTTMTSNSSLTITDDGTFQTKYLYGSGTISISGSDALTVGIDNATDEYTFSGVIQDASDGAGAFTKEGTSILTLTGNNTYTGGTTISGGTLQIGNGGTTGSIQGDILNNGTLAFNRSDDLIYTGVISESSGSSGSFVKAGAGTLTLTGINTYSGGTTLSGGAVIAGSDSAFGDSGGLVSVTANTSLESDDDARTLGNDFTIDLGSTLTVDGLFDLWLTGDIDGEGGLTKEGDSTLTLSGNNTYTGATLVSGGILQVMGDDALGNGELTILGSAELIVADIVTVLGNNIVIDLGQTFTVGEVGDMTLAGDINGDGSLLKVGDGTLTLSGDSTYHGGTNLSAGGIEVGSDTALGDGTLTVSGASALSAGASSITLVNAFTLNDDLTISGDNDLTLDDVIDGTGALIKEDAGTLTMNGVNTYSGGTTLSAGGITVGNDDAISTGSLTVNGVSELSAGASSVTLANAVTLSDTLTISGDNDLTLTNVISGTGALAKTGSGAFVLSGDSSAYTGPTTISGGTLAVNNALGGAVTVNGGTLAGTGTLSDAVTVASGGTIAPGNSIGTLYTGDLAVAGTVEIEIDAAGNSDLIDVTGTVDISGATLDLQPFGSLGSLAILTTHTIIENDGVDAVTGMFTSGTGLDTQGDFFSAVDTVGGDGNDVTLDVYRTSITLTDGVDISESITFPTNFGDFTFTVAGSDSATFSGSFSQTNTPLGVIKDGTGTLTFTGANTYTGGTTLLGGTVIAGNDNAFGSSDGVISVAANTSLESDDDGRTLGYNFDINSGSTLTVDGAFDLLLTGDIDGEGGLTKAGDGTLTLGGDNTYSGGTNINAGTVVASGGSAISDSGTVTIADVDGATLQLNADETIGSLAGGGSTGGEVNLQSYTMTVGDVNDTTFEGVILGTGGLVKEGSGTLTLSGDNTYSGDTNISGGTIIVSGGSAISDSGTVTIADVLGATLQLNANETIGSLAGGGSMGGEVNLQNYTLTVGDANDTAFEGVISGAGGLVKEDVGTLALTGTNTYSGGTTLSGGTVIAGNDSAFGGGLVTVTSNTSLESDRDDRMLGNDFTIDLNSTLTVDGLFGLLLTGDIDGEGGLTKEGDGTLTLSGNNTYTGATLVSGGILQVMGDDALGNGTLTILGSAELIVADIVTDLGNDIAIDPGQTFTVGELGDMTLSGVISGDGSLLKVGSGTLTLSGINTYSGGTTLSGGGLTVGDDDALGDGSLTVDGASELSADISSVTIDNAVTLNDELTVTGDNDLTLDGAIGGTGGLVKEDDGTLTLTGTNTYSGGTTLSGGTVIAGSNIAFGDSEGLVSVTANTSLESDHDDRMLGNDFTIGLNSTLTVDGLFDLLLTGDIDGEGGLTKIGDGTLTLSGNNTYTGATLVSGGILQVMNDDALGDGTLTILGSAELIVDDIVTDLGNDIAIDPGQTFTVGEFGDMTLSGVISGDGSLLKVGSGTLTLSGANDYHGGTTLTAGGIEVSSDTALGDGTLTVSGDSALGAGTSSITLGNAITLDDDLTISGDNDLTLGGAIDGAGALVKAGDGTLTLKGANTYSGDTTILTGTVIVSGGNAINNSGAVTLANVLGATLQLNANETIGSLTGGGSTGGEVKLQSYTLTVGDEYDTEFAGVISGTGGLVKEGSGTLTLSGTNTYSGGFNINAGTVIASGGNAIGDIGTVTLADVSGATLQLNADETIGSLAGGGEVNLLSYTLTVGDVNDTTFDGVISGTGGLVKQGDGALALSGTNTYSGGTNIEAGTIVVDGGNAIGDTGTVTITDGATLQLDADETVGSLAGGGSTGGEVKLQSYTLTVGDANDTTFDGVISGTGGLVKQGDGTLILSNSDNIYTGGTTVNEGILIINGNMASANMNVANGAMLAGVMSLAGNYNNAGTISPGNSIGTVTVAGNLTLTDTSIYDMEIESTAGAGVGNDLIDVGGTADVDGTLNIISISGYTPNGGDTFTILEADGGVSGEFSTILENFGAYDVKAIYDANDITIQLVAVPFTDVVTPPHLTSVADAFARIADNSPTGDIVDVITQLQGLTDAQLIAAFEQMVPNYLVPQAQATFKGIDVQNNNFNGRLNELRYGLPKLWSNNMQVQTPEDATAQESADPEVAINFAMQAQETLEQQQETERLSGTQKETRVAEKDTNVTEKGLWGAWANGFGTFGDFDSQESQAGYEFNTGGVTFGFDYRVLDTLAAGAFLGYSNTGVTVDNGFGTSSFSSINTGMYMTWFNDEGFYASGLFGGGVNFYENNRRIRFGAIDRVAESDPTGFYLQTLATGGYEFKKGNWGIGPQLALQWVNLQIGSHSETGADDMNLDVGAFNGNSFVTRLGFRATYEYDTSAMLFVPELVGSWEHEYLDPIDTVNVGVPASGESFSYAGIGTGRDSGLIGVNLIGISHEAPVSFSVQYNVEFTPDDYIVNNVYAGVRISF